MHDQGHSGEPLVGDGYTEGIVRVGDTVRRPARPFTRTVHAYLAHLHATGFGDAPRPLGFDDQGHEVLTFVPGDVPREPLPEYATTDAALEGLARLIRRLHDASAGWDPPPDAQWGALLDTPPPELVPLGDEPELVSHRDYCPGNVVFRDGLPAALIDFDLARPTSRLYDIANALYWWGPFRDPVDRSPALADTDVASRVVLFVDAYGLDARPRRELVPLAVRMVRNFHISARAAAETGGVFLRWWEEGQRERMPRTQAWLEQEAPRLAAALTPSA